MALVDYTSHDEVRMVLGVSIDELTDVQLDFEMVNQGLLGELRDIGVTLPAGFATVVTIDEASRSAAEAAFYGAVKVFAPYAVAQMLLSGLPMFAPKDISDGKAGVTRFASQPYSKTIEEVRANYARYRTLLAAAFGAYSSASVVTTLRPYLSAVAAATDPVTGS